MPGRALTLLSLLLIACKPHPAPPPLHAALANMPSQVLWAWERPEDLRWLPAKVGVAYVAASVSLEADQARVMPRTNPLHVRDDTALIAVVHVDASWRHPPVLNAAQHAAVVQQVLMVAANTAQQGKPQVVQLDFEVRRSQRRFLMDVVRDLRKQLPPSTALSITALASWCAGDYWLEPMAADEVVPMAFRMGHDDPTLRAQLDKAGHFSRPKCRTAIGTATDEPLVNVAAARHYHFSPVPWTAEAWQREFKRSKPQ
jgi:hypothetical protein